MTLSLRPLAGLLVLALAMPAAAAGPSLGLPTLTTAQVEEYSAQSDLADEAVAAKDYVKAARAFQRALKIHGGNEGAWYNLACVQALSGKADQAMESLRKASAAGWSDAAWPAKDGDLTALHERADFKAWLEEVAKAPAAAPAPAPAAADLATTPEQLDELASAAEQQIQAVAPVLGSVERGRASSALAAWKAASWDGIAAAKTDPKERAAASWSAIKSFLRGDLMPRDPGQAGNIAARADRLAAEYPDAPEATSARYAAATARFSGSWGKDEATSKDARKAYADELLLIAATAPDGPGLERTLAQLVSLNDDDIAVARGFHDRLRRVTGDEKKFNELMLSEARGVHYRISGLPEFKAVTLDGRSVSPEDLKGKVTLLDFWATWCGPCRGELPHIKDAYAKYKDKGFEIIGISLDKAKDADPTAFKAWCAENDVTWPQVFDGKFWEAAVAKTFGVKGIPFPLLIGRDGKVAYADDQLRGEELLKRVESLLEAPSSM